MKKLYRSKNDKMLAGVCGGLGEYFAVDSTLIRLGYAVLTILSGIIPCLLLYIMAAIIIPVGENTTMPTQNTNS